MFLTVRVQVFRLFQPNTQARCRSSNQRWLSSAPSYFHHRQKCRQRSASYFVGYFRNDTSKCSITEKAPSSLCEKRGSGKVQLLHLLWRCSSSKRNPREWLLHTILRPFQRHQCRSLLQCQPSTHFYPYGSQLVYPGFHHHCLLLSYLHMQITTPQVTRVMDTQARRIQVMKILMQKSVLNPNEFSAITNLIFLLMKIFWICFGPFYV